MPEVKRNIAIDALRGADILLLCGGAQVLHSIAKLSGMDSLSAQLSHANWGDPLTCWDLVMPLFLFIVGTSMPFAFASYREKSVTSAQITWRIIRRCSLLFLLGMLVQGNLASADPAHMSLFCNTLQAIAEGYLIASLCLLLGGIRTQILVCLACLTTYWALLRFVPYGPSSPGGLFLPHDNLAAFIDRTLQGSWQDGTSYTWILTSLSFGALTLLGVFAGEILRKTTWGHFSLLALVGVGVLCLVAGHLLSFDTPIIKHIYTSSMVLWSSGWCFLLLALFHLLFDLHSALRCLAVPLRIFGCNAILAYVLTQTPGLQGRSLWQGCCEPLIGGLCARAGEAAQFMESVGNLCLLFLLLLFLYRHKIFLRV